MLFEVSVDGHSGVVVVICIARDIGNVGICGYVWSRIWVVVVGIGGHVGSLGSARGIGNVGICGSRSSL